MFWAQSGEACADVLDWLGPTLSWPPWCVCASFLVARGLVARDHLVRACCYSLDRGWRRARQKNRWFSTDLCWQSPIWTSGVLLNIPPEACVGSCIDHESRLCRSFERVKQAHTPEFFLTISVLVDRGLGERNLKNCCWFWPHVRF